MFNFYSPTRRVFLLSSVFEGRETEVQRARYLLKVTWLVSQWQGQEYD